MVMHFWRDCKRPEPRGNGDDVFRAVGQSAERQVKTELLLFLWCVLFPYCVLSNGLVRRLCTVRSVTELDSVAAPPTLPVQGCLERRRKLLRGTPTYRSRRKATQPGSQPVWQPLQCRSLRKVQSETLLRAPSAERREPAESVARALRHAPCVSLSVGTDMPLVGSS